jgi:preprotein translocase subunit SecG
MEEELVPMEEETGESHSEVAVAPGTGLASVLVILTTIFLLLSILMVAIQLYSVYDIGKSQQAIQAKERMVRDSK